MDIINDIIAKDLETERLLLESRDNSKEYERKTAAIREVKVNYGKDIDSYKKLMYNWRARVEEIRRLAGNDDMIGVTTSFDEVEEIVEDIHRIHLRLNEAYCAILNSLPS